MTAKGACTITPSAMARTARSDVGREAVIGRTTRVRGRIEGDGDLVVEGAVEGDIALRGDLRVADGGRVASNVEADAVTVEGELEGDIRARGVVRVGASARLRGDIRGESIAIEEGAELSGRLDADFELPSELAGGAGGKRR
jgi:cytoskeletal protein CcmA (bactofilin family)